MTTTNIFPPSTTALPIGMDDKVAFLIERPGHAPEILLKTHREICDAMDEWRGSTFDPTEFESHCEEYCYEVLESLYPGLDGDQAEYWPTRSRLAHAVKMCAESDEWTDNQKAEVMRPALNHLPVHAVGMSPAFERKHLRMASKHNPARFNFYRLEPYEEAFREEPLVVAEDLEERGLTAGNTVTVNRCHISRGPAYAVQLLCSRFPNGETGFSLFFVDENVLVDISEPDARLVHRFMNDDRFDVLDCFEEQHVQELLFRAERLAVTRRFRDVPDEEREVDA